MPKKRQSASLEYVVLTTKHHEGFCNWPSKASWNWNSLDVGPRRDLVGELSIAVRGKGLRFGTYYSLFEFFNPLYLSDRKNNFSTQDFVTTKTLPELYELVNAYKPDIIWSGGDWEAPDTYWNSTDFLAWLYNDSPVKDTVVTNDRWGQGTLCHHGGFYTCKDRYNPKTKQNHTFEDVTSMDQKAWTFRRDLNINDVYTVEEVIAIIAEVVSCGGNVLINVGPTKEGIIVPVFEDRLRKLGDWLRINGEGIYATQPWTFVNDTLHKNVWYTSKQSNETTTVYAILLQWPSASSFVLVDPIPTQETTVTLLGYSGTFRWIHHTGSGIEIEIPAIPANSMPCRWAWVLKLTNIYN